jgi:hypothetical protein
MSIGTHHFGEYRCPTADAPRSTIVVYGAVACSAILPVRYASVLCCALLSPTAAAQRYCTLLAYALYYCRSYALFCTALLIIALLP